MAIIGYQFDRAKVTAQADATLNSRLTCDKAGVLPDRGNGMSVTVSGLNATINTGMALIFGRLVEITATETVAIPANSSGYLCIIIDLSQVNDWSGMPGSSDYVMTNNQLSVGFVQQLTQQDLNNGGLMYTFNLGAVSSNSSAATYTKNTAAYASDMLLPNIALSGGAVGKVNSSLNSDVTVPVTGINPGYLSSTVPVTKGGTESTTAAGAADKLLFVSRPNTSTICSVISSGSKVVTVNNGWAVLQEGLGSGNNWVADVTMWEDTNPGTSHYIVGTKAYSGSIWLVFESSFSGLVRVSYIVYRIA